MKGLKIVGKTFAGLYTLIYGAILLVFVVMFMVAGMLKPDFMVETIKTLDLKSVKIADLDMPKLTAKYGEDATLHDVLIDEMTKRGIEKEEAEDILEDEHIREFIGLKISSGLDQAILQEKIDYVTTTEIKDTLKNFDLTDNNIKEITDYINEAVTKFNEGVYYE